MFNERERGTLARKGIIIILSLSLLTPIATFLIGPKVA